MRIDTVIDVKTSLGESPIWDAEQERLYFVDSADGRIFRVTPDGAALARWR